MEFLMFVMAVGLVGVAIYAAHHEQKRWLAALKFVADDLGIHVDEGSFFGSPTAAGAVEGHHVTLDTYTVSTGKSSQVYTRVRIQTGVAGLLELSSEGMLSAISKAFMGEDVSLGVPAVDDLLVVRSPLESAALARLGEQGRSAAVAAITGEGATLKDGVIEWTKSGRIKDPVRLKHIVHTMLELARAMDVPDVHEALAGHVAHDPDAGFRYRCLEALAAEAPRSAAAQGAAKAALHDPSPHMRLAAMRFFRVGGASDVAALVADDGSPSEVRASAIDLLVERFATARATVLPAIQQAFSRGRNEAIGAAVRALAALDAVPAVAELRRRLHDADVASRAEIAKAASRADAAEAQPLLLELLDSEEVEIVTAAAGALGEVGTVQAVAALDEAGSGFTTAREIKSATRAAIARIQDRAGGEGGGLSLAEAAGDGGELSLETMTEGALSEVEG